MQETKTVDYILEVVEAVKATQRIPEDTPQAITFFSVHDEWVYGAVYDNRVCPICLEHENKTYRGNEIRAMFPFLEILDLETIHPHAHMPRDDNCRCRLERTLYMGDIGVERQS
jgi:hypothetical protein